MEFAAESLAVAIIPNAERWVPAFKLVNRLLRQGRAVFIVREGAFPRGTFVVPNGLPFIPEEVETLPVSPRDRFLAAPLSAVRVGLYGGGGAPFNHAGILAACGFQVEFLSDASVRAGKLAEIDVFLMPGGGTRAMWGQLEPLGEAGCREIAGFVRRGGMYIGCCAGSYDCIVNTGEFIESCSLQRGLQLLNARPWPGQSGAGFLGIQSPGVGVVKIRNRRPDHPVMYGVADELEIVHYNGPILDPLSERAVDGASGAVGLAEFTGSTERFTPAEAFAGPIPSGTVTYLDQAVAAGRYAVAAGEYGIGRVVAFGSHPEFGFDLPMVEWSDPARMFVNAVMWQASARTGAGLREVVRDAAISSFPPASSLEEVRVAIGELRKEVDLLARFPVDPSPMWLEPDYAMSVFGLGPVEIWTQTLEDLVRFSDELNDIAESLTGRLGVAEPSAATNAFIDRLDRWILDERPAEWEQDGGYQGVRSLLRSATAMCRSAREKWDIRLGPPDGPYGHLFDNPYHLVAGSYLAAIGCVGGAIQLMRGLASEWEMVESLTSAMVAV
jgi:hypothetical protein